MIVAALPDPPPAEVRTQAAPAPKRLQVYKSGRWTLKVHKDPFSNTTQCSLASPGVDIARSVARFRLSGRIDTAQALYRVDDGQPIPWRTHAMHFTSHGYQLETANLGNPSGGVVLVPLNEVAGGQVVYIRPSARARIRTFRLDGLASALQSAKAAGCGADFGEDAPG
jgi:hypothetical protein